MDIYAERTTRLIKEIAKVSRQTGQSIKSIKIDWTTKQGLSIDGGYHTQIIPTVEVVYTH